MSTDTSIVSRNKRVMTMLSPGSNIDFKEVAEHSAMTQTPQADDDNYSLLGPSQLQSSTPHLDSAITEILEFNPLLQRTP
eukprot:15172914-Ditylum_brightwellii.AAC.1